MQQAIWLGDLPIGLISGSGTAQKVQFVQPDHLGSPRVVIDAASNTSVWTWDLTGEAFGATPPNQDPDGDGTAFTLNMRFPGQRFDAATGLNYNYFRDYEPNSGRYVQSDPIGLAGGVNTFGYVFSSPLGSIDPYGLQTNTLDSYCARFGPVACAEAISPTGPNLAPAVLGTGAAAGIWCAVTGCTVPGSKPKDLSPAQESLYDRICANQDDKCSALKNATRKTINDAKLKQTEMFYDKKLYKHAFSTPNRALTGTNTTWLGHGDDLAGRIGKIANMIALGRAMGCDMTEEERMARTLFVPKTPWGY